MVNNLFLLPLPKPENTIYELLNLGAEASVAEIREAKRDAVHQLNKTKRNLERELEKIYKEIPSLKELYLQIQDVYKRKEMDSDGKLSGLEKQLSLFEQKAQVINQNYQSLRLQITEMESKINEINNINIENPEKRIVYDKSSPPCALLKLENGDQEIFKNKGRKLALFIARKEIVSFMAKKGEKSYHPSDLTEDDFISDFTFNPLID